MAERKEYKNAIRSKERIQEAVFNLIKEKEGIENVTISEVVKAAGVNRGTFYNHYKNIESVLQDVENKLVYSFDEALYRNKDANFQDRCIFFFTGLTHYLKENEDGLKYIVKYVPINIYDDFHNKILTSYRSFIIDELKEKIPQDKQHDVMLISELISNGVAATYLSYFKGEIQESLDDISHCAIDLVMRVAQSKF